MFKAAIFILALFAFACTSPEVRGCRDSEGYSLGYQDAMYGLSETKATDRGLACSKSGQTLNFVKYKQGFTAGLIKFCRSEYGFEFGLQGQIYQNTCPKPQETKFLTGYLEGRRRFLSDEILERKGLLESIESDVKHKEKSLQKISVPEKATMMSELNSLKSRKDNVVLELTNLTKELERLKK